MPYELSEWEAIIKVIEACLYPNKIAWYLVDYNWHQGKWKCTKPDIQKKFTAETK